MTKLKMEIYTVSTGVEMTLSWDNEADYRLGRQFLTDMDTACGQSREASADKPEFFYLQNEQQLDALFEFRKRLKSRS